MSNDEAVARLVAELEEVEDTQARIDLVALDLKGEKRYARIDASTLGELLDVSPNSWHRLHLGYAPRFEPSDFEFPFAENVKLLAGRVPEARYTQLTEEAEAVLDEGEGTDIQLTSEEKELLREEYEDQEPQPSPVTLLTTSVRSSDGDELCFESTLSDGYPDGGAWSPYDIAEGSGFDASDYEPMD